MIDQPCAVCGESIESGWLEECKDFYLGTTHLVNYGVCSNCDLVQQVPIPSDTGTFYPSSYPMHHSRGSLVSLARRLLIRGVYFDPGPDAVNTTLLDFGCGDGSYLQAIRPKVGRIIGFESSPHQAEQIKEWLGCEVFSDLEAAGCVLAGGVDVITAHFVMEHLTDLHGAFACWNRILKPGGIVHLAVPNIRSGEARLFGKKWHGLDAPRHICFPEGRSLASLAERHGFLVTRQRYGRFPNTWAASLATVIAGHHSQPIFLACIPIGALMTLILPQGTLVYQLQKDSNPQPR
jgi:SAM-dependent methyltransferase